MKKILSIILSAATALALCTACDKDENNEEGVLTSPDAMIGKWQLVREVVYYNEDGHWYNDVDYDVDNDNHGSLHFETYKADGTFRREHYDLTGTLTWSDTQAWRYENGMLLYPDGERQYQARVIVLTGSKLVMRWDEDYGEYEEHTYRRVE